MNRSRIAAAASAAILLIGTAGSVRAEEPRADHRLGNLIGIKLFRGMVNTAVGWVEIPKQLSLSEQESGPKGLPTGFSKGIFFALGRTMVGVYEIITFPIPLPEDYRPILNPEYVLSDRPSHRDDAS